MGPLLYTLGAIPVTDKGRCKEDLQCHSTVGVCSREQREHQDVSRLQNGHCSLDEECDKTSVSEPHYKSLETQRQL